MNPASEIELAEWRGAVSEKLRGIKDGIDRIEQVTKDHAIEDKVTFTKHDARIAIVERRTANLLARLTMLAAIASFIFDKLGTLVAQHYWPS